jgi:hypothetical protein
MKPLLPQPGGFEDGSRARTRHTGGHIRWAAQTASRSSWVSAQE